MSTPPVRSNEGGLRLSFRQAQAADALSLHALATQVFFDTYATEGIRPALAREAEHKFSASVFRELLERPAGRIVLAEQDGHLVAFAQLHFGTGHALVEEAAAAELERLYVQAPFLRRGVGSLLLARAEALARDEGFATLWLTAWAGNARALAFYRSQDYEERGSTMYEIEGDSFENRLFARSLARDGSAVAPLARTGTDVTIAPAQVTLREISADTVVAITRLSVAENQKGFVAPNAVSLAQALFAPEAWYRAIYFGDEPVGFVMLEDESLCVPPPEHPEIGVWRFMIDARFQGRGIGRVALLRVIEHVRSRKRFASLELSYVPGPGCPEAFYLGFGFQHTGKVDDNEIVLALPLAAEGP